MVDQMAHQPDTIKTIEEDMAELIVEWDKYPRVLAEYHRLLTIMGNIDGDEVCALMMCAAANVDALAGVKRRG